MGCASALVAQRPLLIPTLDLGGAPLVDDDLARHGAAPAAHLTPPYLDGSGATDDGALYMTPRTDAGRDAGHDSPSGTI
ncbi:hypothetical protein ACTNC4_09710, partial [Collinsella sp. HCP3S3_B8]|uniref:hypothetical protein n=1 Tax=Collinsella sp. HCP3S3_B8 TaxID=3438933 RepID=UPI003F8B166F